MSMIAIITARGGSKRIPKKNVKSFMGKPMLAYAVEAAKESNLFDEIMVSTDCDEIADVAKKYGAAVPFMRSPQNSDDYATTFDVLAEVISKYEAQGKTFENMCCIYPCVPFLTSKTLREAYQLMTEKKANAVLPVCKYPVPIEWAMKMDNGVLVPNDRKAQCMRSQDLTPKYFDVGMFYFCKTKLMLCEKTVQPSNTLGYVIDESECQDIDTQSDWEMAEMKYKVLRGK